jgi:MFS family permease
MKTETEQIPDHSKYPDADSVAEQHKSQHAFRYLLAGTFVSTLGTNASILVLPTYAIVSLQASDQQVAALSIAQTLPAAIFSLWVGSKVDKISRSFLIIASDIASFVLALMVGILLFYQLFSLGMLYLAAFLMAMLGLVYNISTQAMVPDLLMKDQVLKGNAWLFGGRATATVLGQLLASRLTTLFFGAAVMVFDGVTHLVRALCLLPILRQQTPGKSSSESRTRVYWTEDLKSSIGYLRKRPELINITGAISTVNLGGAYILAFFFLYMYDTLGLSPVDLGLAFAIGSVSSTLGALAASKLKAGPGLVKYGYMAFATACLALWLLVFATPATALIVLIIYEIFFKFGSAVFSVAMTTRRHHLVDQEYQGRIISIGVFSSNIAMLVGALLATGSSVFLSPTQGVFLGCVLTLLTFYWFLRQWAFRRNA